MYGIAFITARQNFLSDQEYARLIKFGINTEGSFYPWYRKPLPKPGDLEAAVVELDFRYLSVIESDLIGGALVTILIAIAGLTSGWLIDKYYLNKT